MPKTVDIAAISSGLRLHDDGIWYGTESQAVSYPVEGNAGCYAVEDSSFWFRHRNRCIVTVVGAFPPPDRGAIFDIGAGNGFVAAGLAQAGFEVVAVEPGPTGAANARRRGLPHVICATTVTARFRPQTLPAVGMFDVLEHIADDAAFLQSIRDLLLPGGFLYATVPAYAALWSAEDERAGHFRRYSLSRLSRLLSACGFELVFASYIFRWLPVPVWLRRTLPHWVGLSPRPRTAAVVARDHAPPAGLLSRLINATLQTEITALAQRRPMRFGGSCLVVARRTPACCLAGALSLRCLPTETGPQREQNLAYAPHPSQTN